MLPVAILAGGLATRLRPITETVPKALVPVAGEPFIAHQLRQLRSEGVERVVLCLGHLGEQVVDVVQGRDWGMSIDFSFDGDVLLGTGGALRRALPKLGDAFFVLYGDTILDVRYAPVELAFRRSGKPALMTVFRNDVTGHPSNVVFEDGRIRRYDKKTLDPAMHHVDYGLGIVTAGLLLDRPADRPFDLAEIYGALASRDMLAGYEVFRRFYEMGNPASLQELERHLSGDSMGVTDFTRNYYEEVAAVARGIEQPQVDAMIDILADARANGGRLFILGVGGGAGHAGHAVNDFRKIAGIEAYAPTDNVSELTARVNDDGWNTVFANWLKGSRIGAKDVVLVFSVGGGSAERNISANIVEALKVAKSAGARVIGVVGRDGGYTKQVADACVVVPTVNAANVTPHTESFQAVVWHGMVSHPKLLANEMKWESVR